MRRESVTKLVMGMLLAATLSGCFWATTKSEGDTMRKDIKGLDDRISSKEQDLASKISELQKVLDDSAKLLKRNSADLGADVDQLRQEVRSANGLVVGINQGVNELKTQLAAQSQRIDALEGKLGMLETNKPKTPEELWRLGSTAFEAARYTEAVDLFKTLVASYPTHVRAPDAQYFRGQSHGNLKDWDKAIAAYQVVVDKFPTNQLADDALYFAAVAAQQLKNCSEGRAYLALIKQKYPKSNVTKASTELDAQLKKDAKNKSKCAA